MTTVVKRVLLIALCGIPVASGQFSNDFDKESRMQCSNNQAMSYIGGVYHVYYKDRRWRFGCKPSAQATSCFWTSSQNMWDQPLTYSCPGNHFLNGLFSFHHNRFEDRRFSIKCCLVPWKKTKDCYFTKFVNDWHHDINYHVPAGYVIKGLHSYHENVHEDRRWQFNICRF